MPKCRRCTSRSKALAAFLAVAVAVGFAAAVASATSGGSAVPNLPKFVQPWYDHLGQNVGASPLATFKAKRKPPWVVGYASTYAGNTWRRGVLNEFLRLEGVYKKKGLVKDVLVTQANNNVTLHIQQIRQLVDRGADVIITCCASPTGISSAIEYAYKKGVPFVAFVGDEKSPYAINTSVNYYIAGREEAEWLAKRIGYKGNIIDINGIPGTNSADALDQAALNVFKKYPDIHVVCHINGFWTDSIAKSEVIKCLSTHPEKIDGVHVQSAAEWGVIQAFQQSGRPMVPITVAGEASSACFWLKDKTFGKLVDKGFFIWPPAAEANWAWRVALRVLDGQGSKIQSITRPQYVMTKEAAKRDLARLNGGDWTKCSTSSVDWIEVDPQKWMPDKWLNLFFKHPRNL